MGYNTNYTLTQEKNHISAKEFASYILDHNDVMYAINADGDTEESCKWYEHDKYMQDMSKTFPDTVFMLHGEGEESGDLWEKYYHGGQIIFQTKAKITFDKPDLSNIPAPKPKKAECTLPPPGWYCTRKSGHQGPCAASAHDKKGK